MMDAMPATAGLDVHENSIRVAVIGAGELLFERTLDHNHQLVIDTLAAWPGVRVCQEAGPTGFGLHRALIAAGVESVIVAPGLVPSRPGDRVKTDKRDARRLAGLHAVGLLTEIFVPSLELEDLGDLVRAREDARLDRMRARHRLSKFLLRHDREMPTQCWGPTRRAWLGRQAFDLPGQQHAFDDYLQAVDLIDRRIERLEAAIGDHAAAGPHATVIGRLRCIRGIDTLTAVGLVAEAGSSHARRLLIEAAWNGRRRPTVSYELGRRQAGQDPATIERAWRCQQRIHRRWQRMSGRGKPHPKIVVACSRELAGFVWAIATEQPLRD